ncbi:MAG: UbiX family flavin prenyltransferase [Dehalococcoidia bacterium]|nr:UbiX family flavin prenyltransferase [Dehalococcoidia bacterium]
MAIYIVGVTGGSGAPYARRLLQALLAMEHVVKLVASASGEKVMEVEEGLRLGGTVAERERQWKAFLAAPSLGVAQGRFAPLPSGPNPLPPFPEGEGGGLELFGNDDVGASIASGSYPSKAMVIVPCSMGTLGRIAAGASSNLVERAADVMLKERRQLILTPRETPLSRIHLRNMLTVTEAGAEVLPAMPGFYHRPKSVDDLVDFIVGRILDRLGLESALTRRWRGEAKQVELPDE